MSYHIRVSQASAPGVAGQGASATSVGASPLRCGPLHISCISMHILPTDAISALHSTIGKCISMAKAERKREKRKLEAEARAALEMVAAAPAALAEELAAVEAAI